MIFIRLMWTVIREKKKKFTYFSHDLWKVINICEKIYV